MTGRRIARETRVSLDDTLQKAVNALGQGRLDEAEALYAQVLRKDPKDFNAHHHMGVIHLQRGALEASLAAHRRSLAINEQNPAAHRTLGLALAGQGDLQAAAEALQRSLALAPQDADVLNDLALVQMRQGRPDLARDALTAAMAARPDHALAPYNLGVALQLLGRDDEAIAAFQRAVTLNPGFAEAYCNLGLAFVNEGRLGEGVQAYQQAIALKPDFPEAFNNLSKPLVDQGRLEEAAAAAQQAIALRPNYADALNNLAAIQRITGEVGAAINTRLQQVAADPNNLTAQIELINLRRQACDWQDFYAESRRLRDLVDVAEPFLFLNAGATAAEQLRCARNWAAKLGRGAVFAHDREGRGARIRIGYLSSDFRRHATSYLMAELFERHDRARFEVFGYSTGRDDESPMRARLVQAFDHFIDLRPLSHAQAAQRIHADGIDILVDLKGYTGDSRTEILTSRPAPIQVNSLGYPGTMGADFIDYIIADPTVAPLNHQPFYSEAIVNLPHCYQPNDTQRAIAVTRPSRAACGLPEAGVVFCCFNGAYKLSPPLFDVWMRLLLASPASVLWLLAASEGVKANLRREAEARGVAGARLVFGEVLPLEDHLARHRLADLFLDTAPINAHTTASDALWAGLPVLTTLGDSFAGRVAASLVRAVGLPELVAASLADYEAIALALAAEPTRLNELKAKLAAQRDTAPLFDIARYTQDLERAYAVMMEGWRAGLPPAPFAL